MAKEKLNIDMKARKVLDDNFGEICTYSEYMAVDDLTDKRSQDKSFLSEFNDEEIKKYWALVRHGIGVTASVFTGLIIDENGKVSASEIKRILKELETIEAE